MKLSNEYTYTILCEDSQMKSFIISFLREHSIPSGKIRVRNNPPGEGCGEKFVRQEYVKELQILKSHSYKKEALIICIDADSLSCKERLEQLMETEPDDIKKWKTEKRPVVIWIPKRCIETWIAKLKGEAADEEMKYIHSGKPERSKNEARLFKDYCQRIIELDDELPSMVIARDEYARLCELQSE